MGVSFHDGERMIQNRPKMLVGGKARGGERGGAQLRKSLELSQREREGAGPDHRMQLVDTQCQDNASLIV